MSYQTTIGLEVHVQLKTRSKMFCACATDIGTEPNVFICPVCLGYPGAMPMMNAEAVRLTAMAGMMLGSRINHYSKFDRKSYFYPDMPKNYQISQYDQPLCTGGALEIDGGGERRRIGITRIHLEEDVGKSIHYERCSGLDFNRAGMPLMEIVTDPDLQSPEEAFAFLQALKQILLYAQISDCNLENGNMRCDVNISVRPADQAALGTKIEIKNMNTFKGVQNALRFEIERQREVLRKGGGIRQETRRWDPDAGITIAMRVKEDAHDYRYFPEPDLVPVRLDDARIAAWRAELPEGPEERRRRLIRDYALPPYDAGVLAADRRVADFFENAARKGHAKSISNLMMTEVLRLLGEADLTPEECHLAPDALSELAGLLADGAINQPTAKSLLAELFAGGGMPGRLVAERGLAQVSDAGELDAWVARAIADHPGAVDDYLTGKTSAAKFLVGQVMKLSRGKAAPKVVGDCVDRALAALADGANDAGREGGEGL